MRYITPEHCIQNRLGDRPRPAWSAGLLVFRDHPHSQQVLEAFENVRPVQYSLLYNLTHPGIEPFVFEADVAGRTIVIVTRCVWGGPQTAILVEELAALGVPLLVGYGVAGSIDADLPQGTFVVADSTIPADGTSRAYGAESDQAADASLVEAAIASAADAGCDMKRVRAVTVDALYRETQGLVDELRARGGQIINLETSPLYAACSICGIRSVWLGYVSDCLVDGKWDDWFADLGTTARTAAQVCRTLLEKRGHSTFPARPAEK